MTNDGLNAEALEASECGFEIIGSELHMDVKQAMEVFDLGSEMSAWNWRRC